MRLNKIIVSMLVLCCGLTSAFAQDKLLLSVPDYPPFTVVKEGKVSGIGVDFVNKLSKETGIVIEYRGVPNFGHAINAIRAGESDGFFLGSKNSERDAVATITNPVMMNNWIWVLFKDTPLDPKSPDFKASAKIAAPLNSNPAQWIKDNDYKLTASPPEIPLLLKLLQSKRVDALFVPQLVFEQLLVDSSISPSLFKTTLQESKPFGIYLSKTTLAKYPDLLTKFNKAIDKLKK